MSTWKKPPAVPGSVLEVLRTGVQGKIKEPNLAEVAQHFVDMIGGERQLAKMLVDQYRHVETPQSVKTKIMQIVLGHIKTLNDKSGVIEELGLVTDEDLERALDAHIASVAQAKRERMKAQESKGDKPRQTT